MWPGSMKPCSCMSRMPSSLVAPQTPACVVTWTPSSRATSNAAFSGNSGSPVTSKAIWKPSMSSLEPKRRSTKDRKSFEVDHLQAVRPVDGGGHTGLDRLEPRKQVARVDVLRAEDLAPLEVVEDEVLGERPVGAVAAQRGLPHVPVGVDHARHHDAAARVDLGGALGYFETRTDGLDAVADDEDVGVGH